MDRQGAGQQSPLHGRGGTSVGDRGRIRDPARRRHRDRCRDRRATGARAGRAAVFRPRWRRVPAVPRREDRAPCRVRRARNRAGRRAPRSLSRRERKAARILRRCRRRALGRRPGHGQAPRNGASPARPPAVAATFSASNRARRGRLPDLTAAPRACRRGNALVATACTRLLSDAGRPGPADRRAIAQRGVCADAAHARRTGRERILRGADRERHRSYGPCSAAQPGRPDVDGSRAIRGEGARAGMRAIPCLSRLRDAATVVRWHDGAADAENARALRCCIDGARVVLERAFHERGGTPRVCGSQCLHGRPRFLPPARGIARRRLPARPLAADLGESQPRRGITRRPGPSRSARA